MHDSDSTEISDSTESTPATPDRGRPTPRPEHETWRQRHAGLLVALSMLVALVILVALNMN